MRMYVNSGYAALKVNGKWVEVIAGNIYCTKSCTTSSEALSDAKELYSNFYGE